MNADRLREFQGQRLRGRRAAWPRWQLVAGLIVAVLLWLAQA